MTSQPSEGRAWYQWWCGGSDFTGSAGCFPGPPLINFTFLSGLLAALAEAHSHYIDTKQTGQQDVVRLKAQWTSLPPGCR